MKKIIIPALSMLALSATAAEPLLTYKNGPISLSGLVLIDAGYTYTDNQAGGSEIDFQSGMQSPNLIGVSGSYAIDDKLSLIFNLENQFSLEDGKTIGDGIFSRQAWLGLDTAYGKLTFGKQYEFMFESLSQNRLGHKLSAVSLHQMQQGPFDNFILPGPIPGVPDIFHLDFNRISGAWRVDDSLKYVSPEFKGFTAGLMYGGDGVDYAGSKGNKSETKTSSAGINYKGSNLRANAAYTKSEDFLGLGSDIENYGAGLAWDFGKHTFDAIYTKTKNLTNKGEIDVYGVGLNNALAKQVSMYTNFQYMDGNKELKNRNAKQLGTTVLYHYSPNIDFYSSLVYQDASGDGGAQARIAAIAASSNDDSQLIARVGVRFLLY